MQTHPNSVDATGSRAEPAERWPARLVVPRVEGPRQEGDQEARRHDGGRPDAREAGDQRLGSGLLPRRGVHERRHARHRARARERRRLHLPSPRGVRGHVSTQQVPLPSDIGRRPLRELGFRV